MFCLLLCPVPCDEFIRIGKKREEKETKSRRIDSELRWNHMDTCSTQTDNRQLHQIINEKGRGEHAGSYRQMIQQQQKKNKIIKMLK